MRISSSPESSVAQAAVMLHMGSSTRSLLSMFVFASCVGGPTTSLPLDPEGLDAAEPDEPAPGIQPPTAEERREIGSTYDVATGTVTTDLEADLLAIRKTDGSRLLPGTLGPALAQAEGAAPATVVFDDDNRARVTPTTSFPAAARVRLVLEFADGYRSAGTGTVIGSKYVLTAGHVVYSHDHLGWATKITAFPGQDGSYKPYGPALATHLRSVSGWTVDEDSGYDYGLITLDQDVSSQTGAYCLASFSDDTLDSTTAYIYGYPGDKPWGEQWGAGGAIETYSDVSVFYDIDTAGGESGAGVYRLWNGARCVFAVHTGDGYYWLTHYNRATRITSSRFNQILSWMASGT